VNDVLDFSIINTIALYIDKFISLYNNENDDFMFGSFSGLYNDQNAGHLYGSCSRPYNDLNDSPVYAFYSSLF
jgi:hypothetical protein